MKRRPKKAASVPKLVLEEVIGLTIKNASGLASDASAGRCAYLAGCVVVLYDVDTAARKHLMAPSRAPKPLSCIALARQGRGLVAAGESGLMPAILVWDCSTGNLLSELKGHQCGVQSIDFSSDGKSFVSLGYLNDGYICLWDWRNGRLLAKVKASTTFGPILSVSFLSEGSSFITVGRKHLKLWSLGSLKNTITNVGKELSSIEGKPADLGRYKGSSFVSISSPAWTTSKSASSDQAVDSFPMYALTETGILCVLDHGISIGKSVDLKVGKGFALSASENLLACACNSGIVQLFRVPSLLHVGNLNYCESNEHIDLTSMTCPAQASETCLEHADTVPDAMACQFASPTKLAVIYADHSFYVWDVDHIHKVSKCCILVAHSACIWDVQSLPSKNLHENSPMYGDSVYPDEASFATCSADGTIRLWDLALMPHSEGKHEQTHLAVNQQSRNFVDKEPMSSVQLVSCGILEQEIADKELHTQGFRSMAISSDGQYLAAGDCHGNLHVFNLRASSYTCIEEAHGAEILSLSFSNKQTCNNNAELISQCFLVSGSRDRMIHVHNVQRCFDLIESLDDHSAPVTSVILTWDSCKLLSCSADRSILFRDVLITDVGCKVIQRYNQLASHGTIYDMAIDPARKLVVTVGQDKKINKYSLSTGKVLSSFKEEGDPGQPIKVTIDPSGSYLVCSYSNKSLRIYDFVTGEIVAQAMGHAEVITGFIFLPNWKHIISVGGDSCIFIWRLPAPLTSKMLQKTKEKVGCLPAANATQSTTSLKVTQHNAESPVPNVDFDHVSKAVESHKEGNEVTVDGGFREDSTFRFSISRLPKWAQPKVTSKPVQSQESDTKISSTILPSECSNLEITDESISNSLVSSFSGDRPSMIASGCRDIQRCNTRGRILPSKNIACLDETDSPEEGNSSNSESVDSLLKLSEELLIEECTRNDVTDTMSLDVTAMENLSTCPVFENNNNVSSGREECMSNERGVNLNREGDEGGVGNVTTGKALAKKSDTEKSSVHPQAAEVGGHANDFLCEDLFSQHFGNLSTILKLEGRSSIRKSISAHFHVRRDRLSSCKRLFVPATENLGCTACVDLESSLNPLTRSIRDGSRQDTVNQGNETGKRLPFSPTCFPQETDIGDSIKTPLLNNSNLTINGDEMRDSSKGNGMQMGFDECRKALCKLDEAAETALRLYTELGVQQVSRRTSDGDIPEVFALAADTIPSILEKVQALANLVQSDTVDSGSNYKPEALDLEPMIERFAESLSHRVLELLKTNL